MLAGMPLQRITRAGVVLPSPIDPTGVDGPTARQAAGPLWTCPFRGWHVPIDAPATVDQRIVEAAALLPHGGAVTGWAALAWRGARYFSGVGIGGRQLPVTLALDNERSIRQQPGVELCEEWLEPGDVLVIDGLPVTTAERSVCRMLRTTKSLEQRVKVLDMAAFNDLCSPGEVEAYARRSLAGRPHVTRIWEAVPLADENSWSPMESLMRCWWIGSGHPRPLANVPVFELAGRHLVTPDLFDPVAGVAGEYNGPDHVGETPRERDLGREEVYRSLGIEVVTMIGASRASRIGFEQRLRSAYGRATGASGQWTLEQPAWWVDTSTVGRRRALAQVERDIWLRRAG